MRRRCTDSQRYTSFLVTLSLIIGLRFIVTYKFIVNDLETNANEFPESAVSLPDDSKGGDKDLGRGQFLRTPSKKKTVPPLGSLQCDAYGGPSKEIASEMIYWRDIPADAEYENPFQKELKDRDEKYLLFEPDIGGWNNIRMSLETIITIAIAMGRTIVLPPEQQIYLLNKNDKKQKFRFTFHDFFDLNAIQTKYTQIKFISMTDFLENVAMKGKLKNKKTIIRGKESLPYYPPQNNRTNWDGANGANHQDRKILLQYLHDTSYGTTWPPASCFTYFSENPSDLHDDSGIERIKNLIKDLPPSNPRDFNDHNLVPVDASPVERLREHVAGRKDTCLYDKTMQDSLTVYFGVDNAAGHRMLVPFYAFLFFEDWKQDLWTKRFVRDHIRYSDEIICAASRVVDSVRKKAIEHDPIGNPTGIFDTLHIRRGDFQYKDTRLDANKLFEISKAKLKANSTIYIATDETDDNFFQIFKDNYNTYFLKDFAQSALKDLNTNYYGFIDQLVSSRGDQFYGTFYSTFTAYINRMRGHYSVRDHLDGFEKGGIKSYYFTHNNNDMSTYHAIKQPFWAKEFATGWRDIDHDV